ncbi:hypothetical protein Zmor_016330 [Zophobas morio]|uniref:Anamorsin C-terminal domain-containing protein n=1 Tax=Zophobas morio TaxID=2755281 RepID=A0AA38HIH1_9CUCU|nr:hypothetical protein Zmor_016330 [Zophobas morio]
MIRLSIKAYKPEYEIGASIPLIVSLKADACASQPLDHEFLDEDDLLDENDRQKPDPPLLPECGPRSLKKRACKNCTCGFDKKQDGPNEETGQATTSCGNCYLGDAFRCSTCPYLGLPAFEPGQKVILSANQLRSDFD